MARSGARSPSRLALVSRSAISIPHIASRSSSLSDAASWRHCSSRSRHSQLRQLRHRQKGDVFDPRRTRDTRRRRKAHNAALWQVERDARRTRVEVERQRRRVRERRFVDAIDVRRQARQRRREILAFGVSPIETGQPRGFANHHHSDRAASGLDLRPQRAGELVLGAARGRRRGAHLYGITPAPYWRAISLSRSRRRSACSTSSWFSCRGRARAVRLRARVITKDTKTRKGRNATGVPTFSPCDWIRSRTVHRTSPAARRRSTSAAATSRRSCRSCCWSRARSCRSARCRRRSSAAPCGRRCG